jgi:putative holliday junction resolvase
VNNPKLEEFLGIDVGSVRIGVARGNSAARLAQPLKTIGAANSQAEIKKLILEHNAAGVVVGLPRGLDGNETAQTQTVRGWVKSLKTQVNLPFYWQDEALTSHHAERISKQEAGADAVAAAIILQDFLDSPENDRVAV